MQKNEVNKFHQRTSEFFASKNFKEFREQLGHLEIHAKSITQLSFKCCGYGYFPQYKQKMLQNFLKYLKESVVSCPDLQSLKIVFNGFDISGGEIDRICKQVFQALRVVKIRTLWIHTNNLRSCKKEDFEKLFTVMDEAGRQITCEEVSVQMSDWEFQKGYPNYNELVTIFGTFFENIVDSLKFKKFRLEISSWYMKEKQAYNFLKDTLSNQKIKSFFQSSKNAPSNNNNENRNSISGIGESEKEATAQALRYFLENMDAKYMHPTYPHKKTSDKYNHEQKKEHEQMIKRMNEVEEIISKKLIKYPNEYIMQLKVEEFHKQMTTFLGGLLYKLPYIQEYHIDMRNWHSMFGMGNLKKQLDTKVNSKQEFSLIRRSLGLASKAIGKMPVEGEDVGLKTIYTM